MLGYAPQMAGTYAGGTDMLIRMCKCLAAILTNGELLVCFNDPIGVPGLCLRLPRGTTGPVTASLSTTADHPIALGALPVPGLSPAAFLAAPFPGKYAVRFHLPGRPPQSAQASIEDAPKDVILRAP